MEVDTYAGTIQCDVEGSTCRGLTRRHFLQKKAQFFTEMLFRKIREIHCF